MRGDQLARQWRVIRAIEASPGGLTVAEIAEREETGIRTIYRDLESLQAAGFPLYTERVDRVNRWAFIDTFKFKILPLQSRQDAKIVKGNIQVFNAFTMRIGVRGAFARIFFTQSRRGRQYKHFEILEAKLGIFCSSFMSILRGNSLRSLRLGEGFL